MAAKLAVLISVVLLPLAAKAARGEQGLPSADKVIKEARARASSTPSAEGVMKERSDADVLFATFSTADLPALRKAGVRLDSPVIESNGEAVYPISQDDLPAISGVMHEVFKRCGGFFAHETKAQAQAALRPAPVRAKAAEYTIDQQAWIRPLMPRVQESRIRETIESLAAYNNRYYTSDTGVQSASWILSRWQALAKAIPGAQGRLVHHADWKQPSVVLTIPGTDLKDEVVVLGGHEDSINLSGGREARAPGADDNASGIAVLTETLRVLGESGFRPRRTVEFMAYAAEEVGLRGSQDIAESYASSGKKVVGVIQYDMTNFKGADVDMSFLTDNVDNELTVFLEKLTDEYLKAKWGTIECGYACSDHASWNRSGFPSACAFEATMETMDENLHTDHDTLANAGGNAEHSVNFAKLAIAFAGELGKSSTSASKVSAAK